MTPLLPALNLYFYALAAVECSHHLLTHSTQEVSMVHLKVNGQLQSFDGDPEMPLLWYLRDILGMTGTKFGCGMALCGACTVHQNGKAVWSCITTMKRDGGT